MHTLDTGASKRVHVQRCTASLASENLWPERHAQVTEHKTHPHPAPGGPFLVGSRGPAPAQRGVRARREGGYTRNSPQRWIVGKGRAPLSLRPGRGRGGAGCGHTPGVPEAEGRGHAPGALWKPEHRPCGCASGQMAPWSGRPGQCGLSGSAHGARCWMKDCPAGDSTCREGRRTLFPASPADVVRLLRRGALSGLGTGQEGETHSRAGGWQPGPCPQAVSSLPRTWHRLKASRGRPGAGGTAASFV